MTLLNNCIRYTLSALNAGHSIQIICSAYGYKHLIMYSTSEFLLTLGGIPLIGLATDAIGRRTFLPRVTLLLLFGVLIGRQMFDLIPQVFTDRFDVIANMALLMVGFLLGGKLTADFLKQSASKTLWISISTAVVTTLVVAFILMAVGISASMAIILGCIASATAPAATMDIVLESGCEGPFSDLLLSIVALDTVQYRYRPGVDNCRQY